MAPRFVSEEIVPLGGSFDTEAMVRGEPSLPPEFAWGDERLGVARCTRTWRTTKVDRGDTYLKRHYFEFETGDGRVAVVYFERHVRRGVARWNLYTIDRAP
jgi:Family of unknown function (DUF6504)